MPSGIAVAGANRNDFKLAWQTRASIPVARPEPTPEQPQGLCLDKGYDDNEVRERAVAFGDTAHSRARGEEAQAIQREAGYKARENYLGLLHLVCALVTYRCLGLPG